MPDRSDMTLQVGVHVTGSIDGSGEARMKAVYRQLDSHPPSNGVVAANGDIDLNRMDFDGRRFNRQTDITFTLSGTMEGPTGQPLEFRFPRDPEEAIVVKYKGKRTVDGMTARAGASAMSVVLDDEDRESRTYEYCLNVVVATDSRATGDEVTCVLDPLIVNRMR